MAQLPWIRVGKSPPGMTQGKTYHENNACPAQCDSFKVCGLNGSCFFYDAIRLCSARRVSSINRVTFSISFLNRMTVPFSSVALVLVQLSTP